LVGVGSSVVIAIFSKKKNHSKRMTEKKRKRKERPIKKKDKRD
jgi:hypothetical protein